MSSPEQHAILGGKYTGPLPASEARVDVVHGLGTEWIISVLVLQKVDVVVTAEEYPRGRSAVGWQMVMCDWTVIGENMVRLQFADAIPADTYRVVISA